MEFIEIIIVTSFKAAGMFVEIFSDNALRFSVTKYTPD